MESMGVVVSRYIDYLIFSSCICSFLQQHPNFLFIFYKIIILFAEYMQVYCKLITLSSPKLSQSKYLS